MQLAELDVLARNAEFAETRRMTIRISGGICAVFDSCTNAGSAPTGFDDPQVRDLALGYWCEEGDLNPKKQRR